MPEPIRFLRTAPQLLALIPLTVPRADIRSVMGPGLAELRAALAAQSIAPTGPWCTHHHRAPGEIFDFEICLPVATPVTPAGRVQPGLWPATSIAQTTHHGGYEGLGAAWGGFLAELEAAGYAMGEELWECYAIGPAETADVSAWRTVLSKPV